MHAKAKRDSLSKSILGVNNGRQILKQHKEGNTGVKIILPTENRILAQTRRQIAKLRKFIVKMVEKK